MEAWIIRSTITPTIKFTRRKFVRMIINTKYNAQRLLCLIAAMAMSGQASKVTTQKCAKSAFPKVPKLAITSGSVSRCGTPSSTMVKIEPVYMIIPKRSDIQATALMEFPMVCTKMTSSLNMRITRRRRTKRISLNMRKMVNELSGFSSEPPLNKPMGVNTHASKMPMKVTKKSNEPDKFRKYLHQGRSAQIRMISSVTNTIRNTVSTAQKVQLNSSPLLSSMSTPMKPAFKKMIKPKKVSARLL
mmetsp:Transcript_18985/g.55043  ORF Transcript_18985/g.55043 Transcript_18985/m.55043 type:complete len:245 (-) Transcript_18985:445-1179(-)